MIYIVQMSGSDYYKIGYTSHENTQQRMAQLQTACPKLLVLVAEMEGDEIKERELHRLFWEYRTDGGEEWFEIPKEKIQEATNGRQDDGYTSGIAGTSPFDVRPIRRGQQYDPGSRGENVPGQSRAVDNASNQRVLIADGRKQQVRD